MANQIEATITRVGKSVQPPDTVLSFPVNKIMIIQDGDGSFINYNGARYYSSESVADLVDGSPLIEATVIKINSSTQTSSIQIAFHSELVEILPSQGVSGANSVIKYGNTNYYVTEAMSELIAAANAAPTEVTVYQLKTVLTDEQIKALPTTYIEVVPAPGANKMILFYSVVVKSDTTADAYANPDGAEIAIVYGDWDEDASPAGIDADAMFGNSNTYVLILSRENASPLSNNIVNPTDYENKPLKIAGANGAGDFTGGNAANTLEVTVFYSIVDL